jgi:dUTP pyrophosphatase
MKHIIEIQILDDRLHTWGLPQYQTELAAAIDLFACIEAPLEIHAQAAAQLIPSGIALHMNTPDLCAVILPRSGLGHKKGLVLGNSVGLIDADYTAQCFISVWNRNPLTQTEPIVIQPGERIAQMMFLPVVRPTFQVVKAFSQQSQRGSGGFGSTGS